jgi:hypothetical protein
LFSAAEEESAAKEEIESTSRNESARTDLVSNEKKWHTEPAAAACGNTQIPHVPEKTL